MEKMATAASSNHVSMRKRIYWKTSDGLEHGFITKENGNERTGYSYGNGETVEVAKKDITKVITEEN